MTKANHLVVDVYDRNGQGFAVLPEPTISASSGGQSRNKESPQVAVFPQELDQGFEWAPWGTDDRLPTKIREKICQVPMASSTIQKLTALMYGNGLAYYRNSELGEGNVKPKRAFIPQIERWLRKNRISTTWLMPQLMDYRFYINTFSEMILSGDGSQITGLFHKQAEFSRISVMDQSTRRIEKLFLSAEFALGNQPTKQQRIEMPLLDWYDQDAFLGRLSGRRFAWHSRMMTPGTLYYARAWWLGLFRDDGWIDAAAKVPKVINAMMDNQITLKYQILIPESYFEIRYPDWGTYLAEQRKKVIDELIDRINKSLKGSENWFSSIATVFRYDTMRGEPMGKIEILAVDDKIKKDSWVPTSNVADAQVVQGLGLHPSQMGLAPEGGKMGAGSGSDQRESYNTQISLNTMDQEIILEPLNFVSDYNGWGVTFYIDHTSHTTINHQENGLEPSPSTIDPE